MGVMLGGCDVVWESRCMGVGVMLYEFHIFGCTAVWVSC